LLIPHLGGGGAEQVAAQLARRLSRRRYEVHLGLITQAAVEPASLPPWVAVHTLGARRVRVAAVPLLRLVWRIKPDIILSGMAHLNFLVLLLRPLFGSKTLLLVRQNGTASSALAFGDLPGYTRLAYQLLYRHADRVICQTQAMAADLAQTTGISERRMVVLPNPVDVAGIRAAMPEKSNTFTCGPWPDAGPHLLAVGRLAPVKGFDLLLQALAKVREHLPTAMLTILGAGPKEAALKALAVSLGLREAVRFAGHVDHPPAYFAGATLFVLSSRHEGLPNALLEAAAAGLPLVALPASKGLVDLLQCQPGVWLAPEVSANALATSLLAALAVLHPDQRFAHPFVEQFSLNLAVPAYEELIDASLRERQL
jgi:glycosyltransferase involved in cell wall biosynthesis